MNLQKELARKKISPIVIEEKKSNTEDLFYESTEKIYGYIKERFSEYEYTDMIKEINEYCQNIIRDFAPILSQYTDGKCYEDNVAIQQIFKDIINRFFDLNILGRICVKNEE